MLRKKYIPTNVNAKNVDIQGNSVSEPGFAAKFLQTVDMRHSRVCCIVMDEMILLIHRDFFFILMMIHSLYREM